MRNIFLHIRFEVKPADSVNGLTPVLASSGITPNRVLLHARTKGVVKNADCRAVVPLDMLSMSTLLKRLRNKGILVQQGKGSETCYSIAPEYSDTESKESKSN